MFLISINKKGNKILHPDAAKLHPVIGSLTEDELCCIVLGYDYYSPYRQLAEQERLNRARAQLFSNKRAGFWAEEKIRTASEAYISLQYDPRREEVKIYLEKITTMNEAIRASDSPVTIAQYTKINKELRTTINKIEEELLMEEEKESIIIQGGGNLSFLERMMRNRDAYAELIRKRSELQHNKKSITKDGEVLPESNS